MNMAQTLVAFLGRVLLSIIFIGSALHIILEWQVTLQFFNQALTDWLVVHVGDSLFQPLIEWSIEHVAGLLMLAIAFQLIGGLFLLLGIYVRIGSLLLILFLIPATLLFHNFWSIQGDERDMQMTQFLKNLSICGGLLYVLALGKGVGKSHSN